MATTRWKYAWDELEIKIQQKRDQLYKAKELELLSEIQTIMEEVKRKNTSPAPAQKKSGTTHVKRHKNIKRKNKQKKNSNLEQVLKKVIEIIGIE